MACASPRITPGHLAWKISGVHSRGCTGGSRVRARKRINVNGRCMRKGTLLLFLRRCRCRCSRRCRCRCRRRRRRRRTTFAATCVSRKRRRRRSENIGDVILNGPRFSGDPWKVLPGEFMSQQEPRGMLTILRNCQTIDIFRLNVFKLNFAVFSE